MLFIIQLSVMVWQIDIKDKYLQMVAVDCTIWQAVAGAGRCIKGGYVWQVVAGAGRLIDNGYPNKDETVTGGYN